MDAIFDKTVLTLAALAKKLGISYKQINVIGMFGLFGIILVQGIIILALL